jgi:hypothetical protein
MKAKRATIATFVLSIIGVSGASGTPAGFVPSMGLAQDAGQPAVARRIGAIAAVPVARMTSGASATNTPLRRWPWFLLWYSLAKLPHFEPARMWIREMVSIERSNK